MFQGKNIHYSASDHKPLCSFSTRLCRQRRLNGYAFCVRHILEDPTAPFKACGYAIKSSKGACTNPVPKQDTTRKYCNYHMQMLGLLVKPEKSRLKERNPKLKDGKVKEVKVREKEMKLKDILENRNTMTLEDRLKSKFNLHRRKENGPSPANSDDPYAFPDSAADPVCVAVTSPLTPVVAVSPQRPPPAESPSNHVACRPAENGSTTIDVCSYKPDLTSNTPPIPIAKLYPELAEKLEKARVKPEVKLKLENKLTKASANKSSRTMNRLQTKIAQNKIKDKLKKTQGQGSYEWTPESQSPIHVPESPSSGSSQSALPQSSPASMDLDEPDAAGDYQNGQTMSSFTGKSPSVPVLPSPQVATALPLPGQPSPHILPVGGPVVAPSIVPWMAAFASTPNALPTSAPIYMPPAYSTAATSLTIAQSHIPVAMATSATTPSPPSNQGPASLAPLTVNVSLPMTLSLPVAPPLPAPLPAGHCHPRPPHSHLTEAQSRRRLRRLSSVRLYSEYTRQKQHGRDLLPTGIDSSESESSCDEDEHMPWQRQWYVPSTEERNEDEQDDILFFLTRTTKLSLLRSRIRRQLMQLRRAQRRNTAVRNEELRTLQLLLVSAKGSPQAASQVLRETQQPPQQHQRSRATGPPKRQCCHSSERDPSCKSSALPYTNHCIKHIMYNVDQQLFDFCTAKFSDNTQCCVPVFDIQHELPLCAEHAAKFDNYNKKPDQKPKKPRKKTKPSALTRPPKKGKKKRNQKKPLRPQKPMPPLEPTGLTDMPASESGDAKSEAEQETGPETGPDTEAETEMESSAGSQAGPSASSQLPQDELKDIATHLDKSMEVADLREIEASLTADVLEKTLALDGYQSNKLLDETDLHDVFNRLPDEAFDLLTGKNEFVPSREETEALERALLEASADVSYAAQSLEKLSHDPSMLMNENSNDDELTKQIADSILNQHLDSPSNLDAMQDDLGNDHMQDLASISTAELKTISQTLQGPVLQSDEIAPNVTLGGITPQLLQAGQLGIHPVAGPGTLSMLQAQLAQGPLHTGQFHIQMPATTITTLDGTPFTISPQGALIPAGSNAGTVHRLAGQKSEQLDPGAACSSSSRPTLPMSNLQPVLQSLSLPPSSAPGNVTASSAAPLFSGDVSSSISTPPAAEVSNTVPTSVSLDSNILSQNKLASGGPCSTAPTLAHWTPQLQLNPGAPSAQALTFQAAGQPGPGQPLGQPLTFQAPGPAGQPGTFNLLQTATFTPQGIQPGALKLAYPLQAFLPGDLSSVLGNSGLDHALGLSLGSNLASLPQQLATPATSVAMTIQQAPSTQAPPATPSAQSSVNIS